MAQAQPPCVQHRPAGLARFAAAVLNIARDRMPERGQVDADLVGASGVEVTAHECMRALPLDDLVSRTREPALRDHRHPLALLRVTPDGPLELAGLRTHNTPRDCEVRAAQRAPAQLRR